MCTFGQQRCWRKLMLASICRVRKKLRCPIQMHPARSNPNVATLTVQAGMLGACTATVEDRQEKGVIHHYWPSSYTLYICSITYTLECTVSTAKFGILQSSPWLAVVTQLIRSLAVVLLIYTTALSCLTRHSHKSPVWHLLFRWIYVSTLLQLLLDHASD